MRDQLAGTIAVLLSDWDDATEGKNDGWPEDDTADDGGGGGGGGDGVLGVDDGDALGPDDGEALGALDGDVLGVLDGDVLGGDDCSLLGAELVPDDGALDAGQQPSPRATSSQRPLSLIQMAQPKLPAPAPISGTMPSESNSVKLQSVRHQLGLPPAPSL